MIKQRIDNFTKSQEVGLSKLELFLQKPISNDISTRVFVLEGKAGTGKTTIIKYALKREIEKDTNDINKYDINFDMFSTPNVIGVTQSHKAKNVLSQSIHVCKTFAATFGLEVEYQENGSQKFVKPKFKKRDILLACEQDVTAFVHDECSMYDRDMMNYVLNDTNPRSKIIFMGDAGQLPPVSCDGDEDSPIFTLNLPPENKHTLFERVRQSDDNPIIALSDIIYEEIFGSQNMGRVLEALGKENVINGKGIRHATRSNFLDDFKNISKDYTDTKVVAYRNATVDNYNNYIRKHVHNNPDQQFIPGEIIYMTDTFYNEVKGNKYFCYNSDEYIIKEVTRGESVPLKDDPSISIMTDRLIIEKGGHNHLLDAKSPSIPVVNRGSVSNFNKYISKLVFWAKKAPDKKSKSFQWRKFFEFKQNWGSVSYGYCYTGHKIQGSGYKNIYVDINDILTVGMITPKRKLQAIYTAITRATDLVILIKK